MTSKSEPAQGPVITGVRSIVLYVADPERSQRFYGELLGLGRGAEHRGRIEFDLGGVRILLHPTDADAVDESQARHGRTEVYFATPNVDLAVDGLRQAGVEVVQEPVSEPWGERDAAVLDPDGFTVHLTQQLG